MYAHSCSRRTWSRIPARSRLGAVFTNDAAPPGGGGGRQARGLFCKKRKKEIWRKRWRRTVLSNVCSQLWQPHGQPPHFPKGGPFQTLAQPVKSIRPVSVNLRRFGPLLGLCWGATSWTGTMGPSSCLRGTVEDCAARHGSSPGSWMRTGCGSAVNPSSAAAAAASASATNRICKRSPWTVGRRYIYTPAAGRVAMADSAANQIEHVEISHAMGERPVTQTVGVKVVSTNKYWSEDAAEEWRPLGGWFSGFPLSITPFSSGLGVPPPVPAPTPPAPVPPSIAQEGSRWLPTGSKRS